MNDEYAETVVLKDGPLGHNSATARQGSGSPAADNAQSGNSLEVSQATDYPDFEDTSWLT